MRKEYRPLMIVAAVVVVLGFLSFFDIDALTGKVVQNCQEGDDGYDIYDASYCQDAGKFVRDGCTGGKLVEWYCSEDKTECLSKTADCVGLGAVCQNDACMKAN